MSIFLKFYECKATVQLPPSFEKLINRANLEYDFKKNNINEGLLLYTYIKDNITEGIGSEADYQLFKDYFYQNKVKEIIILEKQGTASAQPSDALLPNTYEDYMQKVIQSELEKATANIKQFLLNDHILSSNFHDHQTNCSVCQNNIIGYLYRCTICDNHSICEYCLRKNNNHKHPFFKIK